MSKFKKGDRVRCVSVCPGATQIVGDLYVISRVYDDFVYVEDNPYGMYDHRYEAAPKEFNISTATDQELAEKYRENYKENNEITGVLRSRGFTPEYTKGTCYFKKAITEEIVL